MEDRQQLKKAVPYLLGSWVLGGIVWDSFFGDWQGSVPWMTIVTIGLAIITVAIATVLSVTVTRENKARAVFTGGTARRNWSGVATNIGPQLCPNPIPRLTLEPWRPTGLLGVVAAKRGTPSVGMLYAGNENTTIQQWLDKASATHPLHLALFHALCEILAKHPTTPAAPNLVDHGGLNLIQHTNNVLRGAFAVRENFKFTWPATPGIMLLFNDSQYDPTTIFDDPLLPIAALAHDLGKIRCYVRVGNTVKVSRLIDHGPAGAEMLASMAEWTALPPRDRMTLVQVVAHYHAPRHYPWVRAGRSATAFMPDDDRGPALMDVIHLADLWAGRIESRNIAMDYSDGGKERDDFDALKEGALYALLCDLLMEPGALDGDTKTKLGWKHNGIVYLQERKVRIEMYKRLSSVAKSESTNIDEESLGYRLGDGGYTVTTVLRMQLAQRGLLLQEYDKRFYGPSRALWIVELYDDTRKDRSTGAAKRIAQFPAMIVFKLAPGDMAGAAAMRDIDKTPRIARARWGPSSARAKLPTTEAEIAAANADHSDALREEEISETDTAQAAVKSQRTTVQAPTSVPVARAAKSDQPDLAHLEIVGDGDEALAGPSKASRPGGLDPHVQDVEPDDSADVTGVASEKVSISDDRIRRIIFAITTNLASGFIEHIAKFVDAQQATVAFVRVADLPRAVRGIPDGEAFIELVALVAQGKTHRKEFFAVQNYKEFDGAATFIFPIPGSGADDLEDSAF